MDTNSSRIETAARIAALPDGGLPDDLDRDLRAAMMARGLVLRDTTLAVEAGEVYAVRPAGRERIAAVAWLHPKVKSRRQAVGDALRSTVQGDVAARIAATGNTRPAPGFEVDHAGGFELRDLVELVLRFHPTPGITTTRTARGRRRVLAGEAGELALALHRELAVLRWLPASVNRTRSVERTTAAESGTAAVRVGGVLYVDAHAALVDAVTAALRHDWMTATGIVEPLTGWTVTGWEVAGSFVPRPVVDGAPVTMRDVGLAVVTPEPVAA